MHKTALMTVWDQLWHSHYQAKNLLMCALPTGGAAKAASNTQREPSHQPKPPAYTTPQKIGLLLGPLLFAFVVMFFHPEDLSFESQIRICNENLYKILKVQKNEIFREI